MDRLPALSLAAALAVSLAGCGDDGEIRPEAPPSRVEAVAAPREDPAIRFCDVSAPVGQGTLLVMPAVEGPAMPASGWRWINVWATWCAPCVEEMPRIVEWRARLAADGAPVEPYFVSVDESAETIAAWRAEHASAPESARLSDPAGLPALVAALGLDAGATIPIHALVDPGGHLRCVRTGSVGERDYDAVRGILRGR
jgi:thiol-disulfide isomerase/thioredoxin